MISVNFYNYTGKSNVINKPLNNPVLFDGLLFNNFEVINPVLTIRQTSTNTFKNYNYCYIPIFKRYYFVTSVNIQNDKIIMNLKVDVLKTYETEILNSYGLIVSRENANGYISNRENIYDLRPTIEKLNFSENTPFNENGSIIMVTLKGNV